MTRILLALAASAIAVALPFLVYPVFLIQALSLALFASGFNLLLGYTGILSFGHAALFGTAAYVAGYVAKTWTPYVELSLLAGTGASALLGLVYGLLAVRQRGIYLAMITFALSQLVYFIALQAPFTGGENGLQSIPRGVALGGVDLGSSVAMYFYVLGLFLLSLAVIWRTIHSPFGQVLRAMRDNEPRAVSLGYDVSRFKIMAFVLSGAFSGLAGGTKAIALGIASLSDVYWHVNGEVILMTLLGGLGTFFGPAIGAVLVAAIHNYLAEIGGWVTIIEGIVFLVIVLLFRRGLVGELQPLMARWTARSVRKNAVLPVQAQ